MQTLTFRSSVIALSITYGMPIAINCMQGRRKLPADRAFILPEWFAWIANIVSIVYIVLTTVLFFFPEDLPVTGNNMNYCIVVFAIWMFICTAWWFIHGRKHYTGPKVEIDGAVIVSKEVEADGPAMAKKTSGSAFPDPEKF